MTVKGLIAALTEQENVNFLLTNRIPRAAVTRFMGWFSKIENPIVCAASIACWRLFSDLDLSEAKKTEFKSLHDCFTRELKDGLRPFDPDPRIVASPSDAIIGAHGAIEDTELFQIKGANYSLKDLLGEDELVERHRNGRFVTLRLTSSMYHRFHAPADLQDRAGHLHLWRHLERQSDRAEAGRKTVLQERARGDRDASRSGEALTLVPVAAILVASLRLHCIDRTLNAQTRGASVFPCDVQVHKGDELGWFEHGSTIIVLTPDRFEFCHNVREGARIKAGQPLLRKLG